jgi:RHS repeat-associated protein
VQQSYSYSPVGETTGSGTVANSFQFTGRENDSTGLMYYRARYYAPAWGRFISEDPIGLAGGLNQYAYAGNNPVEFGDPTGLGWREWLEQHVFQPLREVGDAVGRASNFMGTMLVFGGCAPKWVGPDWRTIPEQKLHRSPTERFFLENLTLAASVSGGGSAFPVRFGGLGNVSGGMLSESGALTAAERYLGPGYREIALGVFRSSDDLRQFRMTTSDLTDPVIGPHVHFEAIGPNGRLIIENSHVRLY